MPHINRELKQIVLPIADLQNKYQHQDYLRMTSRNTFQDEVDQRVRKFKLHYLLANEFSDKYICNHIKFCVRKHDVKSLLVKDKSFDGITPMIMAVELGRVTVVREMIKALSGNRAKLNVCINSTNRFGWSPLHFARITSDSISQLLLDKGANASAMTLAGATPSDIEAFVSSHTKSVSADKVDWEIEENAASESVGMKLDCETRGCSISSQPASKIMDRETKGNLLTFSQLVQKGILTRTTGLKEYRDISFVPQSAFNKLFSFVPKAFYPDRMSMMQKYIEYIEGRKVHKFTVAIEDICKKEGFFPIRGLRLNQDHLEFIEVVGPYSGEMWNSHKGSPYISGNLDAFEYANHTRYMNWGPSNVVWQTIQVGGFDVLVVFSAKKEGLKNGDHIYLHYGHTYWRTPIYKPFIIFNKQQLEEFFKGGLKVVTDKWLTMCDDIRSSDLKKRILGFNFRDNLEYPLCCPGAILYLHFKGIVHIQEWLTFISISNLGVIKDWKANAIENKIYPIIVSALNDVLKIETLLNNDKNQLAQLSDWVLNQIGRISFKDIQAKLQNIQEALAKDKNAKLDKLLV